MQRTLPPRSIPAPARTAAALLLAVAVLPAAASSSDLGPHPGAPAWVHDTAG